MLQPCVTVGFEQWIRHGKPEELLKLHRRTLLNMEEAFVDASFSYAKNGPAVGPPATTQFRSPATSAAYNLALRVIDPSAPSVEGRLLENVLARSSRRAVTPNSHPSEAHTTTPTRSIINSRAS